MLDEEAESMLSDTPLDTDGWLEARRELGRFYLRQGRVSDAGSVLRALAGEASCQNSLDEEFRQIDQIREVLEIGDAGETCEIKIPEDGISHITQRRRFYRQTPCVPGRVAIVSTNLAAGGAERQATLTASCLSRLDAEVESVSFHTLSLRRGARNDFYLSTLRDSGIVVTRSPAAELGYFASHPSIEPHIRLLRLLPEDLAVATATWLIDFEERRPEVVHTWQDFASMGGTLAAILAGVPRIVISTRNTRPDNPYRRLKRYMHRAYSCFLNTEGIVLSNNSQSGATDYEQWLGLAPGKIEVVRNGLDVARLDHDRDLLAPEEIRKRLKIPSNAIIIGGVFRLSGEKRPILWVEAAALIAKRFPNAHFVICGDGTMRKEVIERAAELGIEGRVHLAGVQSPIAPWYRAMDLFLLASRKEGMPNVLLEAQCLGIPVVSRGCRWRQ